MSHSIVTLQMDTQEARAAWHAIACAVDLMDAVEAEPGNAIPPHAPLYGQRDRLITVAQRLDHEINCKRLREALQEIGRLSSYDGVKRARIIAHEALSSVPVRGGGEHRCLTPATTTTSPVAAGSAPSGSAYAAASGRERLAS
jgi:hypothetical protein